MRRSAMVLFLAFAVAFVFAACSDDNGSGGGKSGLGESCTKTDDCESGLKCVDLECVQDDEIIVDGDNPVDGDTPVDGDEEAVVDGDDPVDGDAPADGDEETVVDGDDPVDGDTPADGDEEAVVDGDDPVDGDALADGDEEEPLSFSCSNGVCTDPTTGFEWQQTPIDKRKLWGEGKTYCQNLDLNGGGWRLPNISELRNLIRNCSDIETGGACGAQDECSACGVSSGDVCLLEGSCLTDSCNPSSCTDDGGSTGCYWQQELSGGCSGYWSSSPVVDSSYDNGWFVDFLGGKVGVSSNDDSVSNIFYVRCVR